MATIRADALDRLPLFIGQRQFLWKPSVFATRSVSEGLYLTRSLAYASGYDFGKSGDVRLSIERSISVSSKSTVER